MINMGLCYGCRKWAYKWLHKASTNEEVEAIKEYEDSFPQSKEAPEPSQFTIDMYVKKHRIRDTDDEKRRIEHEKDEKSRAAGIAPTFTEEGLPRLTPDEEADANDRMASRQEEIDARKQAAGKGITPWAESKAKEWAKEMEPNPDLNIVKKKRDGE